MKHSIRTGFSFGLTSGVITTLGLMAGLHSGTHSRMVVIGGILTIAIADAFSDALGIHIAEELNKKRTTKEIWESTVSTFLSKFVFTLTFVVPLFLFQLLTAIIVSAVWGLSLLSILSWHIAKEQKVKAWKVVMEHVVIALVVVILTHYVGDCISRAFS